VKYGECSTSAHAHAAKVLSYIDATVLADEDVGEVARQIGVDEDTPKDTLPPSLPAHRFMRAVHAGFATFTITLVDLGEMYL
jgi:hypothetical protein